jgi:hypothetical protein
LPNSARLLCKTTAAQLQKPNVMKMGATSYGDSLTDLKPHFECSLKKCYSKMPTNLQWGCGLFVAFLCPTTPMECLRTRRGMFMNPPIAAHIDFHVCLQFSLLDLSQHYELQYTTEQI